MKREDLAAYRGWQAGVQDAYKFLRDRHPKAAKALRERFNMGPDGTIAQEEKRENSG